MRLGRSRPADLVLLPLGIGLVVGSAAGGWLVGDSAFADLDGSAGSGAFLASWLALVVGAGAVLEFVQTVTRPAATGGIAACVALSAVTPLAFFVAVACGAAAPLLIGLAGVFVSAVWAIRDESRGFQPDPAGAVTSLDLPEGSARSHDG